MTYEISLIFMYELLLFIYELFITALKSTL